MTNFELCRLNLYKRLRIDTSDGRSPSEIKSEIRRMSAKLAEVKSLAEPRLVMGGIRYGSSWNHNDLMNYMQSKFDEYKDAGNYEVLIDFVNFVAIEGVLKTHPRYHFSPNDRED